MNIVFNPKYILKPDDGRALLLPKDELRIDHEMDNSVEYFIHPIHAMILSFINGDCFDNCVNKASQYLNVSNHLIADFIKPLINNKQQVGVSFNNLLLTFPPQTIINSNSKRTDIYNPDIFLYKSLDLKFKRHKTPTRLTLMVNNRCLTNCVYCYADRREKIDCQISLSRIKELISESKSLNVASFSVIGGEFFLYKNWRELLLKLKEQNYSPFLSTKMPLKETDIAFLSEIKIQDLQISLDTLIPSHLQSILKVSADYVDNIKSTLTLLNKYNIKTYIHTIINSQNDSVMDMSSIFDYLKDFSNIEYWKPDLAGYSLYIQDSSYEQIKPLKSNLKKLEIYFQQIKQESKFSINFDGIIIKGDFIINNIEKETRFRNRAACTGNYSNLFILPDGKVTICEELYWHPQFIVGDVTKQDIVEIWNSNKAKNLFAYPQNLISEESVCSTCTQYDECRANKQVCWRDILKTYGEDRWFYPDVNCPKAPTPKYNITI